MQTFLPYSDFTKTFQCLDYRRLGKQRVEAKQILEYVRHASQVLSSGGDLRDAGLGGWSAHPAVRMWYGYENALMLYMNLCIEEWIRRGYKNTLKLNKITGIIEWPYWLGDDKFHASHRSNLLRKNGQWYGQFGWQEPVDLPYVWPMPYYQFVVFDRLLKSKRMEDLIELN